MSVLRASLGTPAMRWAVGGWSFFIAENIILSENRDALQSLLGSSFNYHCLYGGLSSFATASILYAYVKRAREAAPLQWPLAAAPPRMRLLCGLGLQALGLAGLSQALPRLQLPFGPSSLDANSPAAAVAAPTAVTGEQKRESSRAWAVRCPFDFATERELAAGSADGLFGVDRVSRHAGLWSFALTCLGEACVIPSVPQAACLAMPCMVALIGGAHADSRYARGMGGDLPPAIAERTSNVPFLALLTGKQGDGALSKLFSEIKGLNAAAGVAAAALWTLRRAR